MEEQSLSELCCADGAQLTFVSTEGFGGYTLQYGTLTVFGGALVVGLLAAGVTWLVKS